MRLDGPASSPYARVVAAAETPADKQAHQQALGERPNPLRLVRPVERPSKAIEAWQWLRARQPGPFRISCSRRGDGAAFGSVRQLGGKLPRDGGRR